MKKKLEKLREVAYNVFLEGNLPELELKDYITMINALSYSYGINLDFKEFFENINVIASNKYKYFTENFTIFVNLKLYGKKENI